MKTTDERMREFVEYHKTGDGECNGILLKSFADLHKMNVQERYDLAYFYAVTYCIPSAIIIFSEKKELLKAPEEWATACKSRLIFQSDRRYVRVGQNFQKMISEYAKSNSSAEKFIKKTVVGNTINIEKAVSETTKWFFFGRFGAFLFVETLCMLMGYKSANTTIDWKDGDTATSGLMNVFGLDKSADYFDKNEKLPSKLTQKKLDLLYSKLILHIKASGGDTNTTKVETSLCAYRKFYKGSRYNGYYLDRQLEELNHYKGFPEIASEIKELFDLRRNLFAHKYLGELHDWKGVRKDCKTLYKRTGAMM